MAETSAVQTAEIDCDANVLTCERFDVTGYPSFKLIDHGSVYDYS